MGLRYISEPKRQKVSAVMNLTFYWRSRTQMPSSLLCEYVRGGIRKTGPLLVFFRCRLILLAFKALRKFLCLSKNIFHIFIETLDTLKATFSVEFSHSVRSNSLQPHGLQHSRLLCLSLTPGAWYSNSCPSSWWCHPMISSSVIPFSQL